jgi:hypothetical protein
VIHEGENTAIIAMPMLALGTPPRVIAYLSVSRWASPIRCAAVSTGFLS